MAKISPVSAKYIIHSSINIEGVVDKPDVIGAVFGQTEGLLGADLELRELQRSGRIGRIEVNVDTKTGKTQGTIVIPSSLDKAETAIVGAALEIIQRIGPCNAKIRVEKIEDVRISKRGFVVDRAKELLQNLMEQVMPDSQEIADEVAYSVRVMEIQEFGKDRLPAGPGIDDSEEVLIVEGRADVLNLLKHGIKNAISMNGTSVPQTIIDLSKQKVMTAFVDGDRGGDLIIKELGGVAELDFVTKAPDGKEVEEITKKEIHKAIRSKVSFEQVKAELAKEPVNALRKSQFASRGNQRGNQRGNYQQRGSTGNSNYQDRRSQSSAPKKLDDSHKKAFKKVMEDLIGTKGASILDEKLNILGKVPMTELNTTIRSLGNVHAVAIDGPVDKDLIGTAEKSSIKYLIGMEAKATSSKCTIATINDL